MGRSKSDKIKVLILSETADPSRYWERALVRLQSSGIEPFYATVQAAGVIHKTLAEQNTLSVGFDGRTAKDYPRVVTRLAGYVRQNEFDVVHASEAIPAALAGLACKLARGSRCIFHYHHHTSLEKRQRWMSRTGARLSDLVMAVSHAAQRAAIEEDRVPITKTRIAYNGIAPLRDVTPDEVLRLRQSLEIPSDAKVLSIVGRLAEGKGHLTALTAVESVALMRPEPIHLLIVGAGKYEPVIRAAVSETGRAVVHFVGHQQDVVPWFRVANMNLMPSMFESFGLTALEAMSSARPLIASAVGGLLEIVEDEKNGLLVPPGDSDALAAAILRVLNSPELADRLGKGGVERVKSRFTMEKMVEGWIDCYNAVLAG